MTAVATLRDVTRSRERKRESKEKYPECFLPHTLQPFARAYHQSISLSINQSMLRKPKEHTWQESVIWTRIQGGVGKLRNMVNSGKQLGLISSLKNWLRLLLRSDSYLGEGATVCSAYVRRLSAHSSLSICLTSPP